MVMAIPRLKLLQRQDATKKTTLDLGGLSLRRTYVVIIGAEAPEGESADAAATTQFLRRSLNIAVGNVMMPMTDGSPGVKLLTNLCNVVVVGGPHANYYAYALNELCNPRFKITLKKDFDPAEGTWQDFVKAGNLTVDGFLVDETSYPIAEGKGIIGIGKARLLDTIVLLEGWKFEDTCAVGKAFREGKGAGLYSCTYTKVPDMKTCPEDAAYTLDVAPKT